MSPAGALLPPLLAVCRRVLRCCRLCCGGCCQSEKSELRSSGGGGSSRGRPLAAASAMPLAEGIENGTATVAQSWHPPEQQPQQQQQPSLPVPPTRLPQAAPQPQQQGGTAAAADGSAAAWDVEQGCSKVAQESTPTAGCAPAGHAGSNAGADADADADAGWSNKHLLSGNVWLRGQGANGTSANAAATSKPHLPGSTAVVGSNGGASGGASSKHARVPAYLTTSMWGDEGCCGSLCGGQWGSSHVPKMPPLTASQRLTKEAILQVCKGVAVKQQAVMGFWSTSI